MPRTSSSPSHRRAARAAGWLAACSGILSLALAFSARTATLDPAQIREIVLPGGLRLVVKEAHATDLAALQVWIRAGGFLEDETTSGMAHAIEHLAFKGSDARGPGFLDSEIENLGGMLEASTDRDWTRFNCTVSGRYAARVIGMIADALRRPRFTAKDLDAEKPVLLEELNQVSFNPEAQVSRILYQFAFKKHPYRHDVRGTPRFVNQLDLESVRAYYAKHYVPANITLVVVGDVDTAAVERAARAAFPAEPPAAAAALPPDEAACEKPARHAAVTGFSSGYLGLAYPAPSVRDDPDVYAMDLLLTMLESEGTGRLPRVLKGQAAVEATFETRRQPGLLTLFAATAGNIEQVEALLRKEMEFLVTHPIPEEELTMAKRILRGQYALDNEAYSGQAAGLGYYASIDRWQFSTDYLKRVDGITPAQAEAVARKYLIPDRCVAVVLKPRGSAPAIGTGTAAGERGRSASPPAAIFAPSGR